MAGWPWAEIVGLGVALAAAGCITGFLAGLFGVGGGAIVVPVLYQLFQMMGVPDSVRGPLSTGTSLAVIIPTAIQSLRSHTAHGAVDFAVLRAWLIPAVIGVLIGTYGAALGPPWLFKVVFIAFGTFSSIRLLGNLTHLSLGTEILGPPMWASGVVIGALSALVGIGGGQLGSTFMTLYGRSIYQAVGTSSGLGVIVAIPGTLGYIWTGWNKAGRPPLSLGYVSLIGLVAFAPLSVLTAPIGARLAHRLPKRRLEIGFGIFILLISLRFVASLFGY